MQPAPYYVPSGKAPVAGIVYALIAGIAAALVGAAVYALLVHYVPFIYLDVIFCAALGFVVGFAITLGGHAGHLRNTGAYALVALVCGLIATYAQWLVYLSLVLPGNMDDPNTGFAAVLSTLAASPSDLWDIITEINDVGLWSIKKTTVSGGALWAVWGLEAAIITGVSLLLGITGTSTPYSETKGCWMEEEALVPPLTHIDDPEAMKTMLEAGELSSILNIQPSQDANNFSRLSWYHCPQDEFAYVSLKNVKMVMKKKKMEEETETVFEKLRVSFYLASQLADRVRAMVPVVPEPESTTGATA